MGRTTGRMKGLMSERPPRLKPAERDLLPRRCQWALERGSQLDGLEEKSLRELHLSNLHTFVVMYLTKSNTELVLGESDKIVNLEKFLRLQTRSWRSVEQGLQFGYEYGGQFEIQAYNVPHWKTGCFKRLLIALVGQNSPCINNHRHPPIQYSHFLTPSPASSPLTDPPITSTLIP